MTGEPLFVLKDVCNALGITNTRNVVRQLDEDGVSTPDVTDNLGRTTSREFPPALMKT